MTDIPTHEPVNTAGDDTGATLHRDAAVPPPSTPGVPEVAALPAIVPPPPVFEGPPVVPPLPIPLEVAIPPIVPPIAPPVIVPPPLGAPAISSASNPKENDATWVAQREDLLRHKLGLPGTASTEEVKEAWVKHFDSTERAHYHLKPNSTDQELNAAREAEFAKNHHFPALSKAEREIGSLMREHGGRVARKELGFPKDASEQQIYDAYVRRQGTT